MRSYEYLPSLVPERLQAEKIRTLCRCRSPVPGRSQARGLGTGWSPSGLVGWTLVPMGGSVQMRRRSERARRSVCCWCLRPSAAELVEYPSGWTSGSALCQPEQVVLVLASEGCFQTWWRMANQLAVVAEATVPGSVLWRWDPSCQPSSLLGSRFWWTWRAGVHFAASWG